MVTLQFDMLQLGCAAAINEREKRTINDLCAIHALNHTKLHYILFKVAVVVIYTVLSKLKFNMLTLQFDML